MKKLDLVIFTKNNDVIKISQGDNIELENALTELIEDYSLNCISEFDSIEEIILELNSLGIKTTTLKVDITDLFEEE